MKKFILPLMSIAMLMAMASCSSSDDEVAENNNAEGKLVPMTFTATQENNVGTRAALDNSYNVNWQENDAISVFDGTDAENNHKFILTGSVADGKFSGTALSTAESFTAVYPYTSGAQLESDCSVSGITLPAEQTATPYSFDPNAALMMAYTTDKSQLNFKNAVSLVKIETAFACKKIVLSANVDIAGTGTLKYNSGEPSISFNQDQFKTITLKPASGSTVISEGTYYIVVPSITLDGFSISFTADDDKVYTRKSTKSNTFNRSKIKDFGSFAINGDYWYDASRGDKVRADQEVDMGLTVTISNVNYKVIFAKSNLTATGLAANEYDYGDYFAWGALEPWYTSYSEGKFDWKDGKTDGYIPNNAPYYDLSSSSYTKYTDTGVLEAEDDAARQILGGDWQLPTREIWAKLCDNNKYKWEWTTQDSYSGYQVTSKADETKSIFLPAAGRVYCESFQQVTSGGNYWQGTACNKKAYILYFDSYCVDALGSYYDRCYGFSVRPVRLVAE